MEEDQLRQQKEQERRWCIYIHTNKVNGKVYIGQTGQEPKVRWGRNGYKYQNCTLFWRAIQKYGWDNFEHKIIFKDLTQDEANKIEEDLIFKYDSMNPEKGYNLKTGGKNAVPNDIVRKHMRQHHADFSGENNPMFGRRGENSPIYGRKAPEEERKKIGNALRGKHASEEARKNMSKAKQGVFDGRRNPRAKPVLQYELDGTFIRRWDCATDAAKSLGLKSGNGISKCCKKKQKIAGGYIWKYADSNEVEMIGGI